MATKKKAAKKKVAAGRGMAAMPASELVPKPGETFSNMPAPGFSAGRVAATMREIARELAEEPPGLRPDPPIIVGRQLFEDLERVERSIAPRGAVFVDPDDEHLAVRGDD